MPRLLFILLLFSLLPPCAFSEDKAEETRININKLQESIRQHEGKLAESAGKERTLFEELQRLDAALDEQRAQLEGL